MTTRVLRLLLGVAPLVLVLVTGSAGALAAQQPGASCSSGNTSSAINQYCEDIPSATGGSPSPPGAPGPPTPTLSTTLPQAKVGAYHHLSAKERKRAGKLLTIPAPTGSVPISASVSASTSAWSLPTGVALAMVAIAAACGIAAIVRRRQSRTG